MASGGLSILDLNSEILLHRHKTCEENTLRHLLTMFSQISKILYIAGQF